MKSRLVPRSLRGRTILLFGVGSLAVAALFAVSTYLLSRSYLLQQRTDALQRRAAVDARVVSARLNTRGTQVANVLSDLDPLSASAVLVRQNGRWYSSSLDLGAEAVPTALAGLVSTGTPGLQIADVAGRPVAIVGVPMPQVGGALYELAPLDDLAGTLRILGLVLGVGTVLATGLGVGIAFWASRRLLEPLEAMAGASAEIASGQLSRRLDSTDDPDLVTIVGSFNSMVDALQARIERDGRFAGDVSHELKTPLTTLVASVEMLQARRHEMPDRAQHAVQLAAAEVSRFRALVDELIELARFDAGVSDAHSPPLDLHRLLAEALNGSGRPADLLHGDPGVQVRGEKRRLQRAFTNLMDNADRYGKGMISVELLAGTGTARVYVDDAGPGVPVADRDRIFARFATAGGNRGSTKGTGLGLAIVQETASSLGGRVWCTERPGGGARFVVELPTVEHP